MTIPISPQLSVSPSSYDTGGTVITASVSVLNRPDYHGKPAIAGLTSITPKIVCSRTPSGVVSFAVMVSACESTCDAGNAYRDLHFEWDFGDSSGTITSVDQWNGKTVNLNNSQTGPEAAYVYKTAGTYTITLTAKGRATEGGNIISASTTSLLTVGMYFPYLGLATGGSYTLTFEGQTTAAIAYNATKTTLETALIALSNLDATNVRVTYQGCIEFFGSLAGATYTLTADFSGLTGATGIPQLRVEQASATASNVTVSDASGLTAQYFDSTYDGSNGASNGTESRPYTTIAQFSSFVLGGNNRIAYLKRGSTFTMTASIRWENGYGTIRMVAYGSGAKPIISASSTYHFEVEESYGTVSIPSKLGGDIVWEGIDYQSSSSSQMFIAYASNNGTNTYLYSRYTDFLFLDCDYTSSVGLGVASGMISAQLTNGRGRVLSNIYVFNCNLDMGQGDTQGIFTTADQWLAVVGCTFANGDENDVQPYVFDHHIYPSINGHQLYRYIEFQAGNKNFCINANAASDWNAVRYFLCDGCDVTGTQNAIDLSNSHNNYNSGRTGHFDDVVIQFNKIHSGQINSQQLGIYGNNLANITIRDNLFWDNEQTNIISSDVTKPTIYSIYRNRFRDGIVTINAGQLAYHHHNAYHINTGSSAQDVCIGFYAGASSVELWDSDNNTYYAPNATHPFYNNTGAAYVSFATWQGYGNDANGTQEDPVWDDAANGVFIDAPVVSVEWPATFSNLEYSLNGSDWFSYVNQADVSLGTSLSTFTTVYFRASSDANNATYQITATSNSASVDIAAETDQATVTGDGDFGGGSDVNSVWSLSYRRNGSDIVKHTFDWVSSGSGTATLASGLPVSGQIRRIVIIPDATAPTADYDVTLTDSDGIDVLAGQGANLSDSVSSNICSGVPLKDGTTTQVVPVTVDSVLTLNVTNAGDSKAGKVVVYVR